MIIAPVPLPRRPRGPRLVSGIIMATANFPLLSFPPSPSIPFPGEAGGETHLCQRGRELGCESDRGLGSFAIARPDAREKNGVPLPPRHFTPMSSSSSSPRESMRADAWIFPSPEIHEDLLACLFSPCRPVKGRKEGVGVSGK